MTDECRNRSMDVKKMDFKIQISNNKKIDYKISDFFPSNKIFKKRIKNKFKIITALSVFYDAKDPNQFLKSVNKLLKEDGIFLVEHADLLSIIKLKMFDTICHEHLYYYSTKVIINLALKNNLRVFDLKKNNINGGSTQYFICKKNSKYKTNYKVINKILHEDAIIECLISFKRAGASAVVTYFAEEVAKRLR